MSVKSNLKSTLSPVPMVMTFPFFAFIISMILSANPWLSIVTIMVLPLKSFLLPSGISVSSVLITRRLMGESGSGKSFSFDTCPFVFTFWFFPEFIPVPGSDCVVDFFRVLSTAPPGESLPPSGVVSSPGPDRESK